MGIVLLRKRSDRRNHFFDADWLKTGEVEGMRNEWWWSTIGRGSYAGNLGVKVVMASMLSYVGTPPRPMSVSI